MQDFLFVKSNRQYVMIPFNEILYFASDKKLVSVVCEKKTYHIWYTMTRLTEVLPPHMFTRIHKSYIVSLPRIRSFDSEKLVIHSGNRCVNLPIGNTYLNALKGSILILDADHPPHPSTTRAKVREFNDTPVNHLAI